MRRGFPLAVAVVMALSWSVPADCRAQSPLHQLRLTNVESSYGETVEVQVLYTNTSDDDVRGWAFMVAPKVMQLELLDVVRGDGFIGLAVDVDELVEISDGWRADVLLAFAGSVSLPPGVDTELYRVTYLNEVRCPDGALLHFVDGPADAPQPPEVRRLDGTVVEPTVTSGRVTATGIPLPTTFSYIAPTVTIADGATTSIGFSIADSVGEYTQGFAMSVTHDSASVDVLDVVPSGPVALLGGGAGPMFFGASLMTHGWNVGCVYSAIGASFIPFDAGGEEIATVTYVSTGGLGRGTELRFASIPSLPPPGSPSPVANVAVEGGASIPVCAESGEIVLGTSFLRGDVNADGVIDVADAIRALSVLFIAGTAAPDCLDAGDVNDDGAFDSSDAVTVLAALFGSPALSLPEPWPGCGADPTADMLSCEVPTTGCD